MASLTEEFKVHFSPTQQATIDCLKFLAANRYCKTKTFNKNLEAQWWVCSKKGERLFTVRNFTLTHLKDYTLKDKVKIDRVIHYLQNTLEPEFPIFKAPQTREFKETKEPKIPKLIKFVQRPIYLVFNVRTWSDYGTETPLEVTTHKETAYQVAINHLLNQDVVRKSPECSKAAVDWINSSEFTHDASGLERMKSICIQHGLELEHSVQVIECLLNDETYTDD